MSSNILITGATGTIGSMVTEKLLKVNAGMKVLVRSREKSEQLKQLGVTTVIGDMADKDSLRLALKNVDKIFLLSVTSPDSPVIQGNLVNIAREAGVNHIVKLSVRGADVNADFNIGRWHGQTELLIRESGISYTFLQPHSFMQNLFFDAHSIKTQGRIFGMQGSGKIPMIDARDIASVAVKALLEPGHLNKYYVLTGQESISYYEIAHELSVALAKNIIYIPQSAEEGRRSMMASGMPDWLVDDMVKINQKYAAGEGDVVSNDVECLLNRKPFSLKEFIRDHLDRFN
jgi:uncharacterized protein YbjT (DUF2867 family)